MKFTAIPHFEKTIRWSICAYSGNLEMEPFQKKHFKKIPDKVVDALKYCDDPYLCTPYEMTLSQQNTIENKILNKIESMHKFFMFLNNSRFYFSRMYADIKVPLFDTTRKAVAAISQIQLQKEKSGQLCLQRSLLAMKTSKSFKKNGVLFIGALLPTMNMHAWIIESGTQPDAEDREWILYRPLIAFHY